MTKDEYMLDPKEHGKLGAETKGTSQGVICPKYNVSIGKPCAVCDKVRQLWGVFDNTGDERYKKAAKDMSATCAYFLNVVFPNNPDQVVLLEIGKKAGDQIIEGIKLKGWIDIAHPKAGVGREMLVTKSSDGGYNVYSVSPDLQNADWDVPKKALDSRHNLSNIINILTGEGVETFRVSSLKMDESLRFRILPPVTKNGEKGRALAAVWRHWRNTVAEVNGEVPVVVYGLDDNEQTSEGGEDLLPWEEEKTPETSVQDTRSEENKSEHPPCFAMDVAYDPENEECKTCDSFKKCGRAVLKKAV